MRRLLSGAWALLLALAVTAGMWAPTLATAAASTAVRITATMSDTAVMEGQNVTISGHVLGARAASQIILQRRILGTWVPVLSGRTWFGSTYAFRFRPGRGQPVYRVMFNGAHTDGTSPAVTVRVAAPCSPVQPFRNRTQVWFARRA